MKKIWMLGAVLLCGVAHAQVATEVPGRAMFPVSAMGITKIEKTVFDGHEAWKLSDGQTEAVVVPDLGRVMRFGRIGAPNWLWHAPPKTYGPNEWKNVGGDKTWPAPQSQWPAVAGRGWPPPSEWDGTAHKAGVTDGKLWMVSQVAPGFGARVVREFWFEAGGDFVIAQAADKVSGDPLFMSLWSVIQIEPPDAIFLPINPESVYKNNFHWIVKPKVAIDAQAVTPNLLRVIPSAGNDDNNFKIGTDAPISAAVAVQAGWAFVARSAKPDGNYPDGAEHAGFPVELWNMGPTSIHYNELELLSPLNLYKKGSRWRHTIRWSIHRLPTKDINAPEMAAAIETILDEG